MLQNYGNPDYGFKLHAGMIAAALGNIATTEEMIVQAYFPSQWDAGWSVRVGDILSLITHYNLKDAYKLWKIYEKKEVVPLWRVSAAARILQNFGPLSSPDSPSLDSSL